MLGKVELSMASPFKYIFPTEGDINLQVTFDTIYTVEFVQLSPKNWAGLLFTNVSDRSCFTNLNPKSSLSKSCSNKRILVDL